MSDVLLIRGKEPIYGSVELSGDSLSAMFLALSHLLDTDRVVLKNAPRSELFLSFLGYLAKLGVSSQWQSPTQVLLQSEAIQNDISFIEDEKYITIVMLLSAFIVGKRQSCIISSVYRKQLKYYREFGFQFSFHERVIEIRVPDSLTIQKRLDMRDAVTPIVAFLILLKKTFVNIELVVDTHDKRFDSSPLEVASGMTRVVSVPYDQEEFRLFATLGAISSSEVHIATFDLAHSLEYLLLLEDCGISYEVSQHILKIWKDEFHFAHEYDLTHAPIDAIGYLILLASVYANEVIHFIVSRSATLDELIADMNMFGCKVSTEGTADFCVLSVHSSSLGGQKTEIISKECGGVQIIEGALANGKTILSSYSLLDSTIPSLTENLETLHLEVKATKHVS